MKPGKAVHGGEKFGSDGQVLPFPGNSIVCHLDTDSVQHRLLCELQGVARQENFAPAFAELPPSSFHMTVLDLVCDKVREPYAWIKGLSLDAPFELVDREIVHRVSGQPFPKKLRMRFVDFGPYRTTIHIRLEPADDETMEVLSCFRDALSEASGVRHPNHDSYQFHVSLAYLLCSLTKEQERALFQFQDRWSYRLSEGFDILELRAPELVFFENMFFFSPKPNRST